MPRRLAQASCARSRGSLRLRLVTVRLRLCHPYRVRRSLRGFRSHNFLRRTVAAVPEETPASCSSGLAFDLRRELLQVNLLAGRGELVWQQIPILCETHLAA